LFGQMIEFDLDLHGIYLPVFFYWPLTSFVEESAKIWLQSPAISRGLRLNNLSYLAMKKGWVGTGRCPYTITMLSPIWLICSPPSLVITVRTQMGQAVLSVAEQAGHLILRVSIGYTRH
jgi:hypothetical protein